MPTALVLSPHLDDAAFSCGGTMARLVDAGWRVCMATAFTRSAHPATGFALACQLDKGLSADVDYMALRRQEDRAAAAILGVQDVRWLDLPEAPHRGYQSAPALFGPMLASDDIWQPLASIIAGLMEELQPRLVLAPQGLGDHVDHRQVIRATLHVVAADCVAFYRDTPYAMKNSNAQTYQSVPKLECNVAPIKQTLFRKIDAACAYASQVGFQFGGTDAAAASLAAFARQEGGGEPGERFLGVVPA